MESTKRYEEYAYVLDFNMRGRSTTVRGRDGIIVTAIGNDHLTLLELLGIPDSTFEITEKIHIGRDGRAKISSVLGKIPYDKISDSAQSELPDIVETIVHDNEEKFVEYINNARPLTQRIHALELIPGIGKSYLKAVLDERNKKKFASYDDLCQRIGFKDPIKQISKRIMDEITGNVRMSLFVKR